MAFFTTHQCSLFCSSTLNAEETKKLDGFMELLEESNVGEIIKDATKRDTSKGGRNGVNPYHLFATILYAFSNHSGTLRKIEESIHYDLRYMYLMEYESASYVTISEFLNNVVVKHHRKLYSNIVKTIMKNMILTFRIAFLTVQN